MNLLKIMQKRRSIRKYTDEVISKEKLMQILQAGLLSPSGRNIKPCEFIVIRDKDTLTYMSKSRMGGAAKMLEKANCAIVVLADSEKTDVWVEDASIVMSNMHLMASYLEIGSCWIQGRNRIYDKNISTEEILRNKLKFPNNYKLEAILALGISDIILPEHNLEDLDNNKIHWEIF